MEFAEKVRELLKVRRLSQADLAASLGTNQPQISRWLESNTPPKSTYLLKLARTLGVTADYLIDDAQEGPPPMPAQPGPVLPEDELAVLKLYRALRLSEDEALRRLAGRVTIEPADPPGGKSGGNSGGKTGENKGRRRDAI